MSLRRLLCGYMMFKQSVKYDKVRRDRDLWSINFLVHNSLLENYYIIMFSQIYVEYDFQVYGISRLYCGFRYAFPWWKEREIISDVKRSEGLCPLTPEETSLILKALGFDRDTQIYIASGEIYGSAWRLAALRTAFPRIVSDCRQDHLPLTCCAVNIGRAKFWFS